MSLINDMLRDLDHNGRTADDGEEGSEALLAGSSLAHKQRRMAWLPALLSFLLVAAVVLLKPWVMLGESPVMIETAQAEAPITADGKEDIARIDDAAIAEQAEPVTQPEAEQLVAELTDATAVATDETDETVATIANGVEAQAPEVEPVAPEPVERQIVKARETPVAVQTNAEAQEQSRPAPVPRPSTAAEHRGVTVVRSSEWRDKHAAEQAQQLLDDGREQTARAQLRTIVAEHPAPVASATLLATLYLQSGELDLAQELLQSASYLPAPVRVRLSAQLLMAQGDSPSALAMLEGNLAQAQRDEDYRALLAAVQHKQGAYESSANQYRRLLGDFGERPVYWLGLALALDAQGEYSSAVEAYRRARAGQQSAVLNYIDQRIAALAR